MFHNINNWKQILQAFAVAALFLGHPLTSSGDIIVDNSPDTTGGPYISELPNQYGTQIAGDMFFLPDDATITAASIFSRTSFTGGTPVRMKIYENPFGGPIMVQDTFIDFADTMFASSTPGVTRKRASFSPFFLNTGFYWFTMSGLGPDIGQSTGIYEDNSLRIGGTDLTSTTSGDAFFQIEGDFVAVPEPGSLLVLGIAAFGATATRRKRKIGAERPSDRV